ncbi:MAG: metallophosphoesterase [Clostridia bacterium]|nr:metallophosphoesterase [Clostridia bacterium]
MNTYRGKHVSSASWQSSSSSFRRGKHQVKNRRRRLGIIVLAVLAVLLFCYPFIEARLLQTEKVKLKADDLPAEANNLRIVYLSDIHYGFWFSDGDLSRLVARINNLRPDLILFGGDYATDNQSAIAFFQSLQKKGTLHSRYGIFGVIGETDRGDSDFTCTQLTDAMANAGVTPLVNKTQTVHIGARQIYIAGVDDLQTGNPDVKAVSRAVSSKDYVIFLSHNPSIIPDAQLATDASGNLGWFDLGLFGHTHGGQMLFFSPLLGLDEDVPDRYRSGWLKENRVDLLISRGVGTSVWPGRLFCSPQIHYMEVSY